MKRTIIFARWDRRERLAVGVVGIALVSGLAGYLLAPGSSSPTETATQNGSNRKVLYWYDPMGSAGEV